jgi:hypothetical protein
VHAAGRDAHGEKLDYVIVGGGSAGCNGQSLVSRPDVRPAWKPAGVTSTLIHMPAGIAGSFTTHINWNYYTG